MNPELALQAALSVLNLWQQVSARVALGELTAEQGDELFKESHAKMVVGQISSSEALDAAIERRREILGRD